MNGLNPTHYGMLTGLHAPSPKKHLIAFIDDYSRFIVHAEYFENATTENTILAFAMAISRHGKPQAILTDNGTQFTPARAVSGPFTQFCEKNGIKHIPSRVNNPQTNGKIERHWLEYDRHRWRFETLKEYITWYNNRLHGALNLDWAETPEQAFIRKMPPESMIGLMFK